MTSALDDHPPQSSLSVLASPAGRSSGITGLLWLLAVALGTLYPRVMVIAGYPSTDEGVYAFYVQLMYASLASLQGLPDFGVLQLYPALLSWTYSLPWNHLLVLRLVDMAVAALAGWALFRVAAQESGDVVAGAAIACAFSFAINQHAFIQHGFKNSMFAALVPLLLAARLGLDLERKDQSRWWYCGALVAIGVLLRESFLSFALVGWLAVLLAFGWRSCLCYSAAGILTAAAVLLFMAALRGGAGGLVSAYFDTADMFSSLADQRAKLFVAAAGSALREASIGFALGLSALVVVIARFCFGRPRPSTGRFAFWSAIATIPLLEPVLKIGFPYHVSVCLVGLCGLTALAWRSLGPMTPLLRHAVMGAIAAASLAAAWPQVVRLERMFQETRHNLAALRGQAWPSESVAKSNYLRLAEAILQAAPSGGSLSISGFMFALFPLTGMTPSTYELSSLDFRSDASRLRRAIGECPPDVIVISTRQDIPGIKVAAEAVESMKEYEKVAAVPVTPGNHYGNFGGAIYRRAGAPAACKRPVGSGK